MSFRFNRSSHSAMLPWLAAWAWALVLPQGQFAPAQDEEKTDQYVLGPDSKPQEGAPKGKLTAATITSKVYPEVPFKYQVYVPAQYDGSKPAAVMVIQDGNNYVREPRTWHVPVVFDNLIAKHEMPSTIGIFIDPSSQQQRSMEYDTLSDTYAKFLIDDGLRRYHPVKAGFAQSHQVAFRFGKSETFRDMEHDAWRWAWQLAKGD